MSRTAPLPTTAEIVGAYPVPVGYKRASVYDCYVPLVCDQCGASVSDGAANKHTDWHRRLGD